MVKILVYESSCINLVLKSELFSDFCFTCLFVWGFFPPPKGDDDDVVLANSNRLCEIITEDPEF